MGPVLKDPGVVAERIVKEESTKTSTNGWNGQTTHCLELFNELFLYKHEPLFKLAHSSLFLRYQLLQYNCFNTIKDMHLSMCCANRLDETSQGIKLLVSGTLIQVPSPLLQE
jgi:hypothetical protein